MNKMTKINKKFLISTYREIFKNEKNSRFKRVKEIKIENNQNENKTFFFDRTIINNIWDFQSKTNNFSKTQRIFNVIFLFELN